MRTNELGMYRGRMIVANIEKTQDDIWTEVSWGDVIIPVGRVWLIADVKKYIDENFFC